MGGVKIAIFRILIGINFHGCQFHVCPNIWSMETAKFSNFASDFRKYKSHFVVFNYFENEFCQQKQMFPDANGE